MTGSASICSHKTMIKKKSRTQNSPETCHVLTLAMSLNPPDIISHGNILIGSHPISAAHAPSRHFPVHEVPRALDGPTVWVSDHVDLVSICISFNSQATLPLGIMRCTTPSYSLGPEAGSLPLLINRRAGLRPIQQLDNSINYAILDHLAGRYN